MVRIVWATGTQAKIMNEDNEVMKIMSERRGVKQTGRKLIRSAFTDLRQASCVKLEVHVRTVVSFLLHSLT